MTNHAEYVTNQSLSANKSEKKEDNRMKIGQTIMMMKLLDAIQFKRSKAFGVFAGLRDTTETAPIAWLDSVQRRIISDIGLPDDHPEELAISIECLPFSGTTLTKAGILVSDADIRTKYVIQNSEDTPSICGGMSLTEEEESTLRLHPKIRIYDQVQEQDVQFELEKCLATIRWDEKKNSSLSNPYEQGNTHSYLQVYSG